MITILLPAGACSGGGTPSAGASSPAATAREADPAVALIGKVNGRPLYKPFYERNLNFITGRLSRDAASANVERYMNARFEAFDMLVQDELLFQEAEKEGLAASEQEARAEFENAARAAGGQDRFLAGLKREGLTQGVALEGMRRKLSVNRFVTERISKDLSVTDDEAIAWYNEHLDRFTPDAWMKAWQIFISCPRDASPERVKKALDHARSIVASLKAGSDFEQMARDHSEDGTALAGGSLGRIKKGYAQPEFDAVAFHLAPGEISDPVRTDAGFHIIKAGERVGGTPRPFSEVAETCRKGVLNQKTVALLKERSERLRQGSQIDSYLQ